MNRIGTRNGIQLIKASGNTNSFILAEIQIGDWNMDTTASISLPHNLSATEWKTIRHIQAIIKDDADSVYISIDGSYASAPYNDGLVYFNATNIVVERLASALFDSTSYDATSYNRGWVTFFYQPDEYL